MKRIFATRAYCLLLLVVFMLNNTSLLSSEGSPYEAYLGTFTVIKQSDNTVLVKWTTISEHNNQYFSIEHSSDGIHYTDIGKILSLGNTAAGFSYQFTHNKPTIGKNFYRLRMVDISVRNKYSDIRGVYIADNRKVKFSVFPNPATNSVTLNLNIKDGEELKVDLYDVTGNKVFTKTCTIQNEKTELDIESLKTGLYSIVAITSIGMQYSSTLAIMK